MVLSRPLLISAALLAATPALAVDSVTSASRREQRTGTENAAVWIVGRGFVDGVQVVVSGDGVQPVAGRAPEVVPEAERIDGGRGDGIAYFFSIAPGATLGPRDITVTGPDGVSNVVTFKILAEPASTAEALGTQLLENGCMAQLDLLTNTLM